MRCHDDDEAGLEANIFQLGLMPILLLYTLLNNLALTELLSVRSTVGLHFSPAARLPCIKDVHTPFLSLEFGLI